MPVLMEKLGLGKEFEKGRLTFLDLLTDAKPALKFFAQAGERRRTDVVRRVHVGMDGRDDGHQVHPILRVHERIPHEGAIFTTRQANRVGPPPR